MNLHRALLLLAFLLMPAVAPAAALTTAELNALKDTWLDLAQNNEPLRVEGRIASASAKLMKLRNCELPFRPAEPCAAPSARAARA